MFESPTTRLLLADISGLSSVPTEKIRQTILAQLHHHRESLISKIDDDDVMSLQDTTPSCFH